jgi:8-oxo-dGTP diphosphatase
MIEVAAAIIEKDKKILIARRKLEQHMGGLWEFPGGKIEAGETPEQCLERELKEEFKITAVIGLLVDESIFDYGNGKIVRLIAYRAEWLSGDFQLEAHSEVTWVTPSEMSQYKFAPADIKIVETLNNLPF